MSTEFDDYLRASRELNGRVERKELPIATSGAGFEVSPVTFQKVPPLVALVASTDGRITPAGIPAANQALWPKLNAGMAAAGLQARHPCIYFYSQGAQGSFVLEIGFPFPQMPDPPPAGVRVRRDEEHWCASVVLIGDFMKHIGAAWDAVKGEVAARGLARSGEDREIYHHMTDFICTEVQIGLSGEPSLT
jgi:hypothetical protein